MTEPLRPPEPLTARTAARDAAHFRRTLVRVMAVQVGTLVLLWIMQQYFSA